MQQKPDEYYVIFESWSLDPNQWSMVIDSMAVLLTISGFFIAFMVYNIQRNDSSKDAFDFFQSSLPELRESIMNAINDLQEFHDSIDLDDFINPVLSASLNDKFLTKINLVDLSRFYAQNRNLNRSVFRQFPVDSNFFGDYHTYITNEIDYFRTNYHNKKKIYSQWKLLRSPDFFSADMDKESAVYKNFYMQWAERLNKDISESNLYNRNKSEIKNNQESVNANIENLAQKIHPFIAENKRANKVNILATEIIVAHTDIERMKVRIRKTLAKDIAKFERV